MENILDFLITQRDDLKKNITKVKSALCNAPKNTLRVTYIRGKARYYEHHAVSANHKTSYSYIRKKDVKRAGELAQSEYYKKTLPLLTEQEMIVSQFLDKYDPHAIDAIFTNMDPARKALITPLYTDEETFIKNWQSEQYIGKAISSDTPEIYTERGERVRSKSEKILADKFYMMGIPYRYEYPLYLSGITCYPDFTLLNVKLRKSIYWEHFGMMDDPEYVRAMIRKVDTYVQHGIMPGRDLLLTYESQSMSLNMRTVEAMLQYYLQ